MALHQLGLELLLYNLLGLILLGVVLDGKVYLTGPFRWQVLEASVFLTLDVEAMFYARRPV